MGGNKVKVVLCKDTMVLNVDDGPLNGLYEATQEIILEGNIDIQNNKNVILRAAEVKVNGVVDVNAGATLIVEKDGCQ